MESSNVGEEIMAKKSNKYGVDAFRYMPYMIGGWAGGVIILYFLKKMAEEPNDTQRQQNTIAPRSSSNYWIQNINNAWRRSKVRVARRISQEPEWMTE
jgi:hypothetical protein